MKRTVIFSGTTEGRTLSKMLSGEGIKHTVCVATGYGAALMDDEPSVSVHTGRMDKEEMIRFFKEQGFDTVVDATHPYAVEASQNIEDASRSCGISYIRVTRDEEDMTHDGMSYYESIEECARAVDKLSGNILLTTGSKELKNYLDNVSKETASATYVRVLPSAESIRICEEEGIAADHVIAMHGPFSKEMNEALIRQYDIRHLITKDSGSTGGFSEKIDAAAACKSTVHVIARPCEENGVSVPDCFEMITGRKAERAAVVKITLIGIGPGGRGCMTEDAASAIRECDALFGAARLVKGFDGLRTYEIYRASDIIPVIESEKIRNAVILFSGDSGFFSGTKAMVEDLRRLKKDANVSVYPGISSVSYLAARLGISYDDACLTSIHGKNSDEDIHKLAGTVRYNEKVFVLLSGGNDVAAASRILLDSGLNGNITVGSDLSYESEKITTMTFEEALSFDDTGICTAFIENKNATGRPVMNIVRDDELIRDNVPMTKECIRHESIIRLDLKENDLFYDIGGGTGSVAIEAASLSDGISVVTIEKDHDAVELIKKNISKCALGNVKVIEGDAANALKDMPRPDCVFIGGSGGKLRDIIKILHSKGDGIRFVINAVTFETVEEITALIKEYAPSDDEAVMISVSNVKKAGSHRMLQAQNPVYIFSFTL